MSEEWIEVDPRTRARLFELASARGMSAGQYVGHLVGVRPELSQAEREELARQTEEYLREHFGFDPTPEERAKARAWLTGLATEAEEHRGRRATA